MRHWFSEFYRKIIKNKFISYQRIDFFGTIDL